MVKLETQKKAAALLKLAKRKNGVTKAEAAQRLGEPITPAVIAFARDLGMVADPPRGANVRYYFSPEMA